VLAFRQKMETEEARGSDRRRGRVVEFCHAWIQSKLGLRPFQVRGLTKVRMEMLWTCLSYNLQPWMRLRKPRPTPAAGSIQKSAGSGKDGVDTNRTSQKDKISLAPQKPPCARRFFTASNQRDAARQLAAGRHPEIQRRSFGWCGRVRHPPPDNSTAFAWMV